MSLNSLLIIGEYKKLYFLVLGVHKLTFGYTNRTLTVSEDTTLPVVCWESCDPCSSGPASYNVTFEVDMNAVSQSFTAPEINGAFNGWCGNCWQMTDPDGDNVWEYTVYLHLVIL